MTSNDWSCSDTSQQQDPRQNPSLRTHDTTDSRRRRRILSTTSRQPRRSRIQDRDSRIRDRNRGQSLKDSTHTWVTHRHKVRILFGCLPRGIHSDSNFESLLVHFSTSPPIERGEEISSTHQAQQAPTRTPNLNGIALEIRNCATQDSKSLLAPTTVFVETRDRFRTSQRELGIQVSTFIF